MEAAQTSDTQISETITPVEPVISTPIVPPVEKPEKPALAVTETPTPVVLTTRPKKFLNTVPATPSQPTSFWSRLKTQHYVGAIVVIALAVAVGTQVHLPHNKLLKLVPTAAPTAIVTKVPMPTTTPTTKPTVTMTPSPTVTIPPRYIYIRVTATPTHVAQ